MVMGHKWSSKINRIESLNLKSNDAFRLADKDVNIIISLSEKENTNLKERFKNYKGRNLNKEFKWDQPIEREVW